MVSELGYSIKNGFNESTESSNGLGCQKFTRMLEMLLTTRGTHLQWSARCKERGRKVYM